MKTSLIHIENCQIKSLETALSVAHHLDQLEKTIGIHSVRISFKDCFICPDIDLTVLSNSSVPMEKLIGGLFIKMDKIRYGKESKYSRKSAG